MKNIFLIIMLLSAFMVLTGCSDDDSSTSAISCTTLQATAVEKYTAMVESMDMTTFFPTAASCSDLVTAMQALVDNSCNTPEAVLEEGETAEAVTAADVAEIQTVCDMIGRVNTTP